MHDEIKTYELTDGDGTTTDFILKNMGELYDLSGGSPDRPHRHSYFTLLMVKQGKGSHIIDFKEYELFGNSLHFIHPGQVHQLIASEKPEGWVINFSKLFLVHNHISDQMIDDVYLFNKHSESPPLPIPGNQFDRYLDIIRQIRHYDGMEIAYKRDALGALLKLLLIQSSNHCTRYKNENPQSIETGNQLVRHFKELIDLHYQQYHKVTDYAEMLAVTSEYNRNKDKEGKFLQIWIFPDRKNVAPRYDQISLSDLEKENQFYQILSPNPDDEGVWIYQQAWFHMGKFTAKKSLSYQLKNKTNGVYIFVLEGKTKVDGQELEQRDGLGISETSAIPFEVEDGTRLLLMEVPMHI